jgi:diaminopimelate decarboxylase
MSTEVQSTSRDAQQATEALKRAARRARELAERTGTPCYVLRDGRIVDIARKGHLLQTAAENQEGTTETRTTHSGDEAP